MKADLTRNSFNPLKHFSRVLMQQGRVQLDADWNEQTGILLHLMRRMAADCFGTANSPNGGFALNTVGTAKAVPDDFSIAPGSYYVDGILCELESTPVAILSFDNSNANRISVANWTVDGQPFQVGQYLEIYDNSQTPVAASIVSRVTQVDYTNLKLTMDVSLSAFQQAGNGLVRRVATYQSQPDLPDPPALSTAGSSYQVYLDVWERAITCVEDDSIREVALNGPDTAARARVVWQVKTLSATNLNGCLSQAALTAQLQPSNRGLLRARVQPAVASTDPCTISPDSLYRGVENQLYRVEVHTGSNDPSGQPPSFKMSRENGAVVFPITKLSTGSNATTVTLGNLGRDDRFGLAVGDYVEVQDDNSVLNNTPGQLLQVQSIDTVNLSVTLSGSTTASIGADPTLHPLLRRWDHKAGDPTQGGLTLGKDGAALIPLTITAPNAVGVWLDLEDGVQVQFDMVMQQQFRSGDYWLIPARVATGNIIWPQETATDARGNTVNNPAAVPPGGIIHHYAPLAIVSTSSGNDPGIQRCGIYYNRNPVERAPVATATPVARANPAQATVIDKVPPSDVAKQATVAKETPVATEVPVEKQGIPVATAQSARLDTAAQAQAKAAPADTAKPAAKP